MPQLLTLDGTRYHFNVASLTSVAEIDPDSAQKVTTVSGLSDGPLHISDSPETFLQKIGAADQFVRLTRPDDSNVWINAAAVAVIRSPAADEFPPGANCVITLGTPQAVKESMEEVRQLLNAHGADL